MTRDQEQSPVPSSKPDQHRGEEFGAQHQSSRRRGRRANYRAQSEAHQAFVRALHAKIEHRLASQINEEVQVEIANLLRLLGTMSWETIADNRVYFEMAFDLLAEDQPNMTVIRSLRFNLAEVKDRSGKGLARLISFLCGDTPMYAVLSGLLTVLLLSLAVLFLMSEGHRLATHTTKGMGYDLPLLDTVNKMPVGQLMLLIHAAFLGSIVSIVARFRDFLSIAAFSSLLIYISVVTRPFVAVMFAIFAFMMMKAGVVSFLGIDLNGSAAPYLAWGIGFLCGFSERLAQDFVVRAEGSFGTSSPLERKPPD